MKWQKLAGHRWRLEGGTVDDPLVAFIERKPDGRVLVEDSFGEPRGLFEGDDAWEKGRELAESLVN